MFCSMQHSSFYPLLSPPGGWLGKRTIMQKCEKLNKCTLQTCTITNKKEDLSLLWIVEVYSEDGDDTLLSNIGKHLQGYTASQPR
jgi:hypothetical protein